MIQLDLLAMAQNKSLQEEAAVFLTQSLNKDLRAFRFLHQAYDVPISFAASSNEQYVSQPLLPLAIQDHNTRNFFWGELTYSWLFTSGVGTYSIEGRLYTASSSWISAYSGSPQVTLFNYDQASPPPAILPPTLAPHFLTSAITFELETDAASAIEMVVFVNWFGLSFSVS